MTITVADIKIMASARMVDATDGGGQMSATALQDGVENNVFPDISTLNRAQGALQLRKVFPAVLNAGTDTLLGTHVILDDVPDDPDVFGLVMPAATSFNPLTQTVADLALELNASASSESYKYRGSVTITAVAAAAASVLSISGLRVPFIPKSTTSSAVSGALAAPNSQGAFVTAWEPTGQTGTLGTQGAGILKLGNTDLNGILHCPDGSISGSFTYVAPAGTDFNNGAGATQFPTTVTGTVTSSSLDGSVTFFADGPFGTRVYTNSGSGRYWTNSATTLPPASTNISCSEILMDIALPRKKVTLANGSSFDAQIETASALNTIRVDYSRLTGLGSLEKHVALQVRTSEKIEGLHLTYGRVNRATGILTLVFDSDMRDISVYYAAGGSTTPLLPAALVSSGLISAGTASVTLASGKSFGTATFDVNGGGEAALRAYGAVVGNGPILNVSGVTRGSVTPGGVMSLPGGNDGRSIVNWYGCQRTSSIPVSSFTGTVETNLAPITVTGNTAASVAFSATANSAGVFATPPVSGTYDKTTGALSLTFSTPVKLEDLAYSGTRNNPSLATCDLWGINQALFASDGTVPILHLNDVVVLQNTIEIAAATYVNGNTVNCGRTDLANVRIIGTNNAGILTGWSVDKVTGVITISSIAGWLQPVRIRHSIEHVSVVAQVTASTVTLNRALTRQFASGSVLSSALVVGDMGARTGLGFSQGTWTNVWSDTRIGDAITPQYQQISNPIVVSNLGSATERWAIIFTSASVFRLVGESLGQIATGDINSVFVPVNPATGTPYFTIAATGWGSGWANGNVLRFNTTGGNAPVWMARVVRPSAPNSNADSLTIAVRGDIDA